MQKIVLPIIQMIQERKSIEEILSKIGTMYFDNALLDDYASRKFRGEFVAALVKMAKMVKVEERFINDNPRYLLLSILDKIKTFELHHIWESYLLELFSAFILGFDQESFNKYIELEQLSRLDHYNVFFTRDELISELKNHTKLYDYRQIVKVEIFGVESYDGREFTQEEYIIHLVKLDEVDEEYVINAYNELMDNEMMDNEDETEEERKLYQRVEDSHQTIFENFSGTSRFYYQFHKIDLPV